MTTTESTYRNGQRVAIEIDGELFPGQITVSNTPGFWYAKLADGSPVGEIAESRITPVATLAHGDRVTVTDARWRNHTVSTLSGYGKKYDTYSGPDGMARYAESLIRNSGKAVWLGAEASVISARRETPVKRIDVRSGDLVWVDSATPGEGGWYRVALPGRANGDSSQLIRA